MVSHRDIIMIGGGGAIGVAQTLLIQRFIEPTNPNLVPQLGAFGKPTALFGIVGGIAAIAIAMVGRRYQFLHSLMGSDFRMDYALLAYGGAALTTGLLAGFSGGGIGATSRAFPRTASMRAVPAGSGYSMVNRRESNLL